MGLHPPSLAFEVADHHELFSSEMAGQHRTDGVVPSSKRRYSAGTRLMLTGMDDTVPEYFVQDPARLYRIYRSTGLLQELALVSIRLLFESKNVSSIHQTTPIDNLFSKIIKPSGLLNRDTEADVNHEQRFEDFQRPARVYL
jgi:hypothetical protein